MNNFKMATVDVKGMVEDGVIDLDAVFDRAEWSIAEHIGTYTACVYGPDCDEPGEIDVFLETSTKYGITAYRWVEKEGNRTYERGAITIDRNEAVEGGEEYASENNEE